jgi:hypothetical protein
MIFFSEQELKEEKNAESRIIVERTPLLQQLRKAFRGRWYTEPWRAGRKMWNNILSEKVCAAHTPRPSGSRER